MRTDEHKNPAAFTTDIAKQGGLVLGVDFLIGREFPESPAMHTAKLLGDPVALTIKVIDKIGFYTTKSGSNRWVYISMPKFIWDSLTADQKRDVIGFMYRHEGGTEMISLFPNYSRL